MPLPKESFKILETIDSTNSYAMKLVHAGNAEHGNSYFAIKQTAGKGRQSKLWLSKPGENITMSIVADVGFLSVHDQFYLSVACALGVCDFLKKYVKENIKIKWPNDLLWNKGKMGGILIENVIKGNVWQWSVIGVGININQTEFEPGLVYEPASLKQITNNNYDVIEMAKELKQSVLQRIDQLRQKDFEGLLNEYSEDLFGLNEKVKLRKGNIVFETTITGVSKEGQLKTFDIMERNFAFDEVTWVL